MVISVNMQEIISFLENKMTVQGVQTSLNLVKVVGRLNPPIDQTIKEIKEYFSQTEYTPILSQDKDRHMVQFGIFKRADTAHKYWLNILLFVATILTTIFAGYLNSGDLGSGLIFSASIMAILTCHELGHYFVSQKQGMLTTLPYFIPMPFHFIGTFGAVIQMKSMVPSRKALLKVGMAGPICGFLIAVPIAAIGIMLSETKVVAGGASYMRLGDSLLFYILGKIFHPNLAPGADILLHPMAFAGWLGFLVTSLNLIPIGQLDGGHVAYSIMLRKHKYLYIPIIAGMVILGFLWVGWFFWALLAFYFARREPMIQDAITPLTREEKLFALLPLIVLILTFIPRPFALD